MKKIGLFAIIFSLMLSMVVACNAADTDSSSAVQSSGILSSSISHDSDSSSATQSSEEASSSKVESTNSSSALQTDEADSSSEQNSVDSSSKQNSVDSSSEQNSVDSSSEQNSVDSSSEQNSVDSSKEDSSLDSGEKQFCVVKFDSDGGTEIDTILVAKGEKISKPEDPTKITTACEYIFIGWFSNGKEWDFENDVVTDGILLIAMWEEGEKYTEPFLPKD